MVVGAGVALTTAATLVGCGGGVGGGEPGGSTSGSSATTTTTATSTTTQPTTPPAPTSDPHLLTITADGARSLEQLTRDKDQAVEVSGSGVDFYVTKLNGVPQTDSQVWRLFDQLPGSVEQIYHDGTPDGADRHVNPSAVPPGTHVFPAGTVIHWSYGPPISH